MSALLNSFRLLFTVALAFLLVSAPAFAQDHEASSHTGDLNVGDVIMNHIKDDHVWHFWDGHYGTWYLPVIVYSSERGLDIFSSRNLFDDHHNYVSYNGYKKEGGRIVLESGTSVLDFSITKNVAMLFINAALLLFIFVKVAGQYKKNPGRAPSGLQSFLEPVILFVRDEVVKPNIGPKYERYLPYMLTLFFFILLGNFLGLLPGAANLTGNIAVTFTLAFFTFLITNFSGNKNYWGHIFWTPGVPLPLRLIILPVEVIGMFTKPFALLIRLFAAITAGHVVILSLLCLAFVFRAYWVGGVASAFVVLISLIELLVAAIQAYVFTLFSSLYIGMAIEEHEHH